LYVINWQGVNQVEDDTARGLPLFGLKPQEWFPAEARESDFGDD